MQTNLCSSYHVKLWFARVFVVKEKASMVASMQVYEAYACKKHIEHAEHAKQT